MQTEAMKERDRIMNESRFSSSFKCPYSNVIDVNCSHCFSEIFEVSLMSKMRCV